MKITKTSSLTKVEHIMEIDVTFAQLWQIDNRTDLVQNIVPHLTPAEREFLLTGITSEEWELAFADMVE
jgi:hypothetical protein